MCRITGFWDFRYEGGYDIQAVATDMRDTMKHGGPDDAGVYVDPTEPLALTHRRLSILDLSLLGHQPMSDASGDVWITYNGEVYNFQEIREELLEKGHYFRSHSDTEVILEAFREWGENAVHRFRGMFAFALWDRQKHELLLCRDRAGVKPLYWYLHDGLFMFGSELKAFHRHPRFKPEIDRRAVSTFLTHGYIGSPYAIYCDSHKLEPGHYLKIGASGRVALSRYWDIRSAYARGVQLEKQGWWRTHPEEEVAEQLDQILTESFRLRMVADVPVGVFLSGGMDSSTVAAILAREGFRLKTFTIGFEDEKFSEAIHAKKVAGHLGTEHTELYCTAKDAFEIIPKLPEMFDEPFGDTSAIPTHLVSRLARQQVAVSLSADGGDELLCGYDTYWTLKKRRNRQRRWPFLRYVGEAMSHIRPNHVHTMYNAGRFMFPEMNDLRHHFVSVHDQLRAPGLEELHYLAKTSFLGSEVRAHNLPFPYAPFGGVQGLDEYHTMMVMDFNSYLPDDVLVKVDRASMAVALESREPFLDHRLVEFLASLPSSFKYREGISKYILRKIAYKYVPREILDRPKQGFDVPIERWFKNDLRQMFFEYLSRDRLLRDGFFDPGTVQVLLEDCVAGNSKSVARLWLLLMFTMWLERWKSVS